MSTAITIIEPTDLTEAGAVLATNKGYVATYKSKADVLKEKAAKVGTKLTPELDAEINKFLVSAKTCAATMEATRKPYTAKLNTVISMFTAQENAILKEIYPPLQAIRDASVTAYAKEEAETRRKEQLELDKAKERITLLADAEQQIRNAYSDILSNDKAELLNAFETATAETIDGLVELLESVNPTFKPEVYDAIVPVITPTLLDAGDVGEILSKAKPEGKLALIQSHYNTELRNYSAHLLTLIPNRRKEIEEGLQCAEAEKIRQDEADALAAIQAKADEEEAARISKQVAEAVVDVQIIQSARTVRMPSSRPIESYTINILKREGWAEIFKFYFTHSGEDELGKIKLDQMKAFAERKAKSDNLKIDSDSVEYVVKYKATARKVA